MLLPLLQNNLLAAATSNTLDATETGADTLVASGQVVVQGSLAVAEAGADTAAALGQVIVTGALAVAEAGADTAAALGQVIVSGALAVLEAGADALAAVGSAISATATGFLVALEVGADTCAITNVVAQTAGAQVGDRFDTATARLARYGITSRPAQVGGDRTVSATVHTHALRLPRRANTTR